MNVGILVIATNKYIQFIPNLVESIEKYFLTNHNVTVFLFTNDQEYVHPMVEKIYIEHKPWPYIPLLQYHTFYNNKEKLSQTDYLFFIDADALIYDTIGEEVLSDLVAVTHPGYLGKRGTPETNPKSTAFIAEHEEVHYSAGGVSGGKTEEYLKMCEVISKRVDIDLENDIIALWHDESHLNRYLVDNPPTLQLSPAYCYPENWDLPFEKKILVLDKDHHDIRGVKKEGKIIKKIKKLLGIRPKDEWSRG